MRLAMKYLMSISDHKFVNETKRHTYTFLSPANFRKGDCEFIKIEVFVSKVKGKRNTVVRVFTEQ